MDTQSVHGEDEIIPHVHVTLKRSTLDILLDRYNRLGNEMQELQCKTDKLLKIALASAKNDQVKCFTLMW
jgi:hypothetical protein